MAFATRTLRDTTSAVTILVDIDADAASNLILDGSGLNAFANGAKVDIRNATNTTATSADVEAVTRGTSGFIMIEFKKRDGGWTG